jgi:hypothetical protein
MKFLYFLSTFVGHFTLLDPDSEYGSGSTDLIESGSNTDLDPKPWLRGPVAIRTFLEVLSSND